MKFTLFGDYDVGVDTFWNHVFFDHEFTRHLYQNGLKFDNLDVLSDELFDDGGRKRVIQAHPNFEMPKPIQKKLGERFFYVEHGHFDPQYKRWTTDIHIPKLGQKLTIRSIMSFQDQGVNRSCRNVEFELNVNIFGFRRLVEPFLVRTLTQSYEDARVVTNQWIHSHIPEDLRYLGNAN